jgi:type 1 glutamine amidotransferase
MSLLLRLSSLTALIVLLGFTAEPQGDKSIRIQLITGGHPHEISFYDVFQADTDFDITVNPHPSAYQEEFRHDCDVLVLYDLADTNDDRERQHLREFLEAGKGVVVLHHALADNQHWPWWYEDVVGGRYLMAPDGDLPASTYKHDQALTIHRTMKHAITDGIVDFDIVDEVYNHVWLSPKIQVLLETNHPLSEKPVAWICPYQKSRVVYIQLGHGRQAHENPAYRKVVRNAVLWAAARR